VKRAVTDAELNWITQSAQNYIGYARQYLAGPGTPKVGF
jgi:hypothetical protein